MSVTIDAASLSRSRRYCEGLTRHAAKNFYYGLKLLPEPKRSAMFAIYAYMRLVDDIADDDDFRTPQRRREELELWRAQTHAVLAGQTPEAGGHEVWPAFAETVQQYRVPAKVFDAVIDGQLQDLNGISFDTFDALRDYCYRVAGVVGLASIYIWGFEGGAATEALAIDRGVAFQLTNILRDLREDAERGRVYLPSSELSQHGLTREDVTRGTGGEKFLALMRFQIERAQSLYQSSSPLEECINRDSRATLVAMTQIYRGLLRKIAIRPERVLSERVSLSLFSKLRIGWRAVRAK